MPDEDRVPRGDRLLAEAVRLLEEMGYDAAGEVRVTVRSLSGREVTLSGPPPPAPEEEPARPGGVPPGWRWLSPAAEKVVASLRREGGWVKSARLARLAGLALTGELRAILRELRERGVVELTQGQGCRLRGE